MFWQIIEHKNYASYTETHQIVVTVIISHKPHITLFLQIIFDRKI
jgi:hypothetical protein